MFNNDNANANANANANEDERVIIHLPDLTSDQFLRLYFQIKKDFQIE